MNEHKNCHGQWSGFRFQVSCYCKCHNKKHRALLEVEGPETNAAGNDAQQPSFMEGIPHT